MLATYIMLTLVVYPVLWISVLVGPPHKLETYRKITKRFRDADVAWYLMFAGAWMLSMFWDRLVIGIASSIAEMLSFTFIGQVIIFSIIASQQKRIRTYLKHQVDHWIPEVCNEYIPEVAEDYTEIEAEKRILDTIARWKKKDTITETLLKGLYEANLPLTDAPHIREQIYQETITWRQKKNVKRIFRDGSWHVVNLRQIVWLRPHP